MRREREREIKRQTDRQADRQIETETETETEYFLGFLLLNKQGNTHNSGSASMTEEKTKHFYNQKRHSISIVGFCRKQLSTVILKVILKLAAATTLPSLPRGTHEAHKSTK